MSVPVCRRCGEPFRTAVGYQSPPGTPIQPDEALRTCWESMRLLLRSECQVVGPGASEVTAAIRLALAQARVALGED